MTHLGSVVNCIVARNTGYLIRLERTHNRSVGRIFVKAAHARMAVQALQVAVLAIQMDCFGRCTYILHIKIAKSLELVLQRAVHGVVGVAGITGLVRWHEVVLKMLRRDITRIQHLQALSVSFHTVARNAVCRRLGTLHVEGHTRTYA